MMKAKFALTLSILGLTVGFLSLASNLHAEEGHKHHEHGHMQKDTNQHQHQHSDTAKGKKVRCAFDGMMMKASAMVEVKHEGKTHYFCNQQQAEMFKTHSHKYFKQIPMGHLTFNLNVLTVDEHKKMMEDMGMGGMMKMDPMKGKTHRIAVYLTQHNRDIQLDDIELALQITSPSGTATTVPLEYNKMMKTYDGYAALPAGGQYKIQALITTAGVSVSM